MYTYSETGISEKKETAWSELNRLYYVLCCYVIYTGDCPIVYCITNTYGLLVMEYIQVSEAPECICNRYTMVCLPVHGDNTQALASGLFYVQMDSHGKTILYHLHQCRPCTLRGLSC